MRTSDATQIIQKEFNNTYTLWEKTREERDGVVKERRMLEAENDYTK